MMIDDEQPHGIQRASALRGTTLFVCEQSGNWALQLRRLTDGASDVRIVETRSAGECVEALGRVPTSRVPTSWVAVELAAGNCEAALDLLLALDARFPQARTVVLAARSMTAYRWLVRELGAVGFIASPWQLPTLVEMLSRNAAVTHEQQDIAQDQTLNIAAEIWERLPWQQSRAGTL